jgi:hypothetical protein
MTERGPAKSTEAIGWLSPLMGQGGAERSEVTP